MPGTDMRAYRRSLLFGLAAFLFSALLPVVLTALRILPREQAYYFSWTIEMVCIVVALLALFIMNRRKSAVRMTTAESGNDKD